MVPKRVNDLVAECRCLLRIKQQNARVRIVPRTQSNPETTRRTRSETHAAIIISHFLATISSLSFSQPSSVSQHPEGDNLTGVVFALLRGFYFKNR